jgi:hypothetical protein
MTTEPDSDPASVEAARGEDPPIPLFLKVVWSVFAIWAAWYVVTYLVPEFRLWRSGA